LARHILREAAAPTQQEATMASIDTIFALSSGRLPSGIAVIRMSGPHVRAALESLFGSLPAPRTARYGRFKSAETTIDHGICLFFPGPGSVTGEDCCEFQLHGSVAGVNAMLEALGAMPGCRLAEAGEFTRRAFLNGRMDLTEVEGLSDLIAAETEAQRRMAIDSTSGRLRDLYMGWRTEILLIRAGIEAEMDFSDQDDVPGSVNDALAARIGLLIKEIDAHLARYRQSEIVRSGYRVVILGAPNAGKSSLLNMLAMRDVAIVTDEPGTTRDLVEVSLDLAGYKIILTDTAGIRESAGMVEALGIGRAIEAAAFADLILSVEDMSDPVEFAAVEHPNVISVGSKLDRAGDQPSGRYDVALSTSTGEGVHLLLEAIVARLKADVGTMEASLPIRERHAAHLAAARDSLVRAMATTEALELKAEELRSAAFAIGRIVGMSDTEELLGEIFSRFCIGK
jgi:tRNA modification GTPase